MSDRKTSSRPPAGLNYARSIIDSSLDMIIAVDNQRRIIEFNRAAEECFGYNREELLGRHVSCLYADEDQGQQVHHHTVAQGRYVQEILNRRKNGAVFPSLLSASVLYDLSGKQVGVMGISRDITRQKEAEEALRRSREEFRSLSCKLQEINQLKDLLLDVITHDLKNPAGVIAGVVDLLQEEFPDNEKVRLIMSSSNNLLKILESTTTLAQVTTGEAIRKQKLNLHGVVRALVTEFRPQFTARGILLDNKLPEDLWVTANPIISEVIRNYISNALKYASQGKRVTIECNSDSFQVTLYVRDEGETIPAGEVEQIFDRFTRLQTMGARGRGLGLAIARRIAAAHGGSVWVEPNRPRGNCFCLRLPQTSG